MLPRVKVLPRLGKPGLNAVRGRWQPALSSAKKELPHAIALIDDARATGLNSKASANKRSKSQWSITGQATIGPPSISSPGVISEKTARAGGLRAVLEKGLKQVSLAREATVLRQKLESPLGSYGALIGKSAPMRQLYQRIGQIAATDAAVLVNGESGTGKELVARTLHDLSPRREETFLALNCAAISPTLMESELFGHEKGAFTNAIERHLGCFEQADGGTLFLDEITEMAAEVQAKFLRVLEEGQVRRIGGTANIPVSVRVVAATNRSPAPAVKEGKLREDLFYRLNVFNLELPPLRERGEDIALLARYFLESFAEKYQRPTLPWATDFIGALQSHSWPGNVRELRNAMERLAVLAPGPSLTAADVQQFCLGAVVADSSDPGPLSLAEAERQAIERALAASGGNKTQSARILGITPKTLKTKFAISNNE
jgi:DNA-binding NtrC family response regulator